MIRTGNVEEQRKGFFKVNKFLGFGGSCDYDAQQWAMLFLAMMTRMFKPAIKRSNEQVPKQLLVKKRTVKLTSSKAKDKETQDRTSKQLPDVKNRRLATSFGWSDHKLEKRNR